MVETMKIEIKKDIMEVDVIPCGDMFAPINSNHELFIKTTAKTTDGCIEGISIRTGRRYWFEPDNMVEKVRKITVEF